MGLGISVPILLSQTVSFLILFGLLYLVAYKPVIKILDERSKRIKESIEQADQVKARLAPVEEDIKKRLQAAAQEEEDIIIRANRAADEIRNKALQNANEEAVTITNKAKAEAAEERQIDIDQMRQEIADLVIRAAGKVIGESLDRQAHLEIINKVLDEMSTIKAG